MGNKKALIKPKIVFFGEALPSQFFERLTDLHICELLSSFDLERACAITDIILVVLGTSLSVHPFASLINRVPLHCPRLLINLEAVGEATKQPSGNSTKHSYLDGKDEIRDGFDFDGRTGRKNGIRDLHFLGTADEGVGKLAQELGWYQELVEMMDREWGILDMAKAAEKELEKKTVEKVEGLEDKKETVVIGEVDELSLLVEKVDIKAGEEKAKSIL